MKTIFIFLFTLLVLPKAFSGPNKFTIHYTADASFQEKTFYKTEEIKEDTKYQDLLKNSSIKEALNQSLLENQKVKTDPEAKIDDLLKIISRIPMEKCLKYMFKHIKKNKIKMSMESLAGYCACYSWDTINRPFNFFNYSIMHMSKNEKGTEKLYLNRTCNKNLSLNLVRDDCLKHGLDNKGARPFLTYNTDERPNFSLKEFMNEYESELGLKDKKEVQKKVNNKTPLPEKRCHTNEYLDENGDCRNQCLKTMNKKSGEYVITSGFIQEPVKKEFKINFENFSPECRVCPKGTRSHYNKCLDKNNCDLVFQNWDKDLKKCVEVCHEFEILDRNGLCINSPCTAFITEGYNLTYFASLYFPGPNKTDFYSGIMEAQKIADTLPIQCPSERADQLLLKFIKDKKNKNKQDELKCKLDLKMMRPNSYIKKSKDSSIIKHGASKYLSQFENYLSEHSPQCLPEEDVCQKNQRRGADGGCTSYYCEKGEVSFYSNTSMSFSCDKSGTCLQCSQVAQRYMDDTPSLTFTAKGNCTPRQSLTVYNKLITQRFNQTLKTLNLCTETWVNQDCQNTQYRPVSLEEILEELRNTNQCDPDSKE